MKSPSPRTLRLALAAAVTFAVVGVVLVGLAAWNLLGIWSGPARPAAAPPPAGITATPASAAPQPAATGVAAPTVATTGGLAVAALADPAWLRRVAQLSKVPQRALAAYAGAAIAVANSQRCQVGWNTLAAIGLVESDHGRYGGSILTPEGVVVPSLFGPALDGRGVARIPDSDAGAIDGDTRWERGTGPMQFLPQTWRRWASQGSGKSGPADPQNIDDAALTAARYLCASGSLTTQRAWIAALWSYNRSIDYQNRVAQAANYFRSIR